jgi:MFS family permease
MPFYRVVIVVRSAMLLGMTLVAALVPAESRWLPGLVLATLALYSLGAGLGGISFMDMVGKVIPPRRRGAFFSLRQFWGGVLGLASSAAIAFLLDEPDGLLFPRNFAVIYGAAFVGLTVSMGTWCFVREPPGEVEARRVRWTEQFARGMRLLRRDKAYRTFVLARLALMLAQLAAPFYVVYAKEALDIPASMVGVYLTMRTAASILSNLAWGRISDRQGNRLLIRITNAVGLVAPLLALLFGLLATALPQAHGTLSWVYALVFISGGAAGTGSGIGNANYLLDIAPPEQRSLYLGFTNTMFGIGFFTSALGGLIVDWTGFGFLLILAAGFYGLALAMSLLMAEPRQAVEDRTSA